MGAKFRRKIAAGQNNRHINRAARYLDMRLSGLEQALTVTLKYLEGKDPDARKAMEAIAADMRKPPDPDPATSPAPNGTGDATEPPAATD